MIYETVHKVFAKICSLVNSFGLLSRALYSIYVSRFYKSIRKINNSSLFLIVWITGFLFWLARFNVSSNFSTSCRKRNVCHLLVSIYKISISYFYLQNINISITMCIGTATMRLMWPLFKCHAYCILKILTFIHSEPSNNTSRG